MLSDHNISENYSLFFFAHQDDEFGVFQKIIDEINVGRRVMCLYLTTGVTKGQSSSIRDKESVLALMKLGVKEENILFLGTTLSISDQDLINHINTATEWITKWLEKINLIEAIYLPAWEGGHPDHDILHAIGIMVAYKKNLYSKCWQFSLYNAFKCIGPFYRVLFPISLNGPIHSSKISLHNRLKFMLICLCYSSQKVSWLGLFPFVFMRYLINGKQHIQPASIKRINERPHLGILYYEKRKFSSWENLSRAIQNAREFPRHLFIKHH